CPHRTNPERVAAAVADGDALCCGDGLGLGDGEDVTLDGIDAVALGAGDEAASGGATLSDRLVRAAEPATITTTTASSNAAAMTRLRARAVTCGCCARRVP